MNSQRLIQTLRVVFLLIIAISLYVGLSGVGAQATAPAKTSADVPTGKPDATIDLATADGIGMIKGEWRYSDTKIVEVNFVGPGADRQPTGASVKTYDYTPHAGGVDFDDSKWETISPTTLDQRRGMAAQKATELRRLLANVEANEKALRLRQDELEARLLAAPAANWREAAEKARYLLKLFASSPSAQDPRRQKLIAAVLRDFERLARK